MCSLHNWDLAEEHLYQLIEFVFMIFLVFSVGWLMKNSYVFCISIHNGFYYSTGSRLQAVAFVWFFIVLNVKKQFVINFNTKLVSIFFIPVMMNYNQNIYFGSPEYFNFNVNLSQDHSIMWWLEQFCLHRNLASVGLRPQSDTKK